MNHHGHLQEGTSISSTSSLTSPLLVTVYADMSTVEPPASHMTNLVPVLQRNDRSRNRCERSRWHQQTCINEYNVLSVREKQAAASASSTKWRYLRAPSFVTSPACIATLSRNFCWSAPQRLGCDRTISARPGKSDQTSRPVLSRRNFWVRCNKYRRKSVYIVESGTDPRSTRKLIRCGHVLT